MPGSQRLATSTRVAALLFAVLVLALAGLVVAYALSARHADRQFALASLSERQASAVARIVALAPAPGVRSPALDQALHDYRELIEEEARLAGEGADARQQREREAAQELDYLAREPGGQARFQALAGTIDRQESAEVLAVRAALAKAGQRSLALAMALAGVALACAGCGAWLLWRSNRSLSALVEVRTARIAAVDASRRLFFAKASHELRTPVAGLRSAAEVALELPDADSEALRETLRHVIAGAAFLSHRIDELLGLAGADDGKLQLAQEPLDLAGIVREAVAQAAPFARSVEVELRLAVIDPVLPMQGDARWLRQALLAVIENGLKFAPMHSALEVVVGRQESGRGAQVRVTDRGPGVVEADLPRIFEAYYQAEAGRQRGGSGLGLALARWVVERHGGRVGASNLAGGGCCIRFDLPLEEKG